MDDVDLPAATCQTSRHVACKKVTVKKRTSQSRDWLYRNCLYRTEIQRTSTRNLASPPPTKKSRYRRLPATCYQTGSPPQACSIRERSRQHRPTRNGWNALPHFTIGHRARRCCHHPSPPENGWVSMATAFLATLQESDRADYRAEPVPGTKAN